MYYAGETVKMLKDSSQIAIYGAGLVASEVATCLMGEPYSLNLECFLVSEKEGNPDTVKGFPVISLKDGRERVDKDTLIVVAVMEKHLDEIRENLHRNGYFHILPMTFESDLWSMIQGNYYRHFCLVQGKDYRTLEGELASVSVPAGREIPEKIEDVVCIYTARCHMDRQIKEDLSRYYWEIPIQAGAALTESQICDLRDNQGDNISHKNGQYCELTALYWIWKHNSSVFAGLCHYRRHFELDEEMLKKLVCSDIDVVLTIPILNFPSVVEVYRHDHEGEDWDVMMEAIHVLAPDYVWTARQLQKGNFYYGYNMVIARKTILDDYCAWLFPILQYCEEHCSVKKDIYQRRYLGFLAERLMGIYFLKHENVYKIVHARKHFVES